MYIILGSFGLKQKRELYNLFPTYLYALILSPRAMPCSLTLYSYFVIHLYRVFRTFTLANLLNKAVQSCMSFFHSVIDNWNIDICQPIDFWTTVAWDFYIVCWEFNKEMPALFKENLELLFSLPKAKM